MVLMGMSLYVILQGKSMVMLVHPIISLFCNFQETNIHVNWHETFLAKLDVNLFSVPQFITTFKPDH